MFGLAVIPKSLVLDTEGSDYSSHFLIRCLIFGKQVAHVPTYKGSCEQKVRQGRLGQAGLHVCLASALGGAQSGSSGP